MWSHPIRSRKWMNIWKSTKVYTAFLFIDHTFWQKNIEDRIKLLESNVLNCCLKITTVYLRKIGLKMREWRFKELRGTMSFTPLSPPPREQNRLISYLLLWPFYYRPEPGINIKTNNRSVDNLKKNTSPQWVEHLSPWYSQLTLVSRYLFDSCQLTITWMAIRMSTIKVNTNCICLGHLASNDRSLQENNAQSIL